MNTRGSSGQKRNGAGEVAADELCFLPPRRIERGIFDSPSMNTRSCLSAQKRKEGPGSSPVGSDKEEVAGANDDDDTSDREQATIKFSFPDRKTSRVMPSQIMVGCCLCWLTRTRGHDGLNKINKILIKINNLLHRPPLNLHGTGGRGLLSWPCRRPG